jgi:hypothetical protein
MTNDHITKLSHKVAENDDKYDYVYDYNYYIAEGNNYYEDIKLN